jgi:hypothetical protein
VDRVVKKYGITDENPSNPNIASIASENNDLIFIKLAYIPFNYSIT